MDGFTCADCKFSYKIKQGNGVMLKCRLMEQQGEKAIVGVTGGELFLRLNGGFVRKACRYFEPKE